MLEVATGRNRPLNVPALEALEAMAGEVPEYAKQQILNAPFDDDLSGLRVMAHRLWEPDGWQDIQRPKQEIGDYVESEGFRVPMRYDSWEDAMSAVGEGKKIIIRSEHPDEYGRFSGLLESFIIDSNKLEDTDHIIGKWAQRGVEPEDILHYAKLDSIDRLPMQRYLQISGTDEGDFYDAMTYSFWEYIPGKNIMVVADDAIAERYHITSYGSRGRGIGGSIYGPDGREVAGLPDEAAMSKDPLDDVQRAELIAEYEAIRQLPRFSDRQCPVMELQLSDGGDIYFLQYHKSRPFRPATEKLDQRDYPVADGWHQAQSVRGALGTLVTLNTALYYTANPGYASLPAYLPDGPEEASFDLHFDIGLTEFVSPTRTAFVSSKSHRNQYRDMADGHHEARSRWFGPAAAMSIGPDAFESIIAGDKKRALMEAVYYNRQMGRFVLDYASDGRVGFIRMNPDAPEQPKIKMEGRLADVS